MNGILIPGKNCWRVERADRAAFIVDGEAYFRAVHEACCRARRSIFIVGWDIHSRVRLIRDEHGDDRPRSLEALLSDLARDRPDLHIYVLTWDFAMIYAMERELFPRYQLRWRSHDRVHFRLDGRHPVGASQHQKLVVVDDRIAFSGGLDLSVWRWDTSRHETDDERRTDPYGKRYRPFHDVQMAVEGAAAAALGELVRDRWSRAGGPDPVEARESTESPWPPSIEPDLRNVEVAIARTSPRHDGRDEVREVERLYLDVIAAAKRFLYVENQYLSSHRVGRALARRLRDPDGPEVILVLPEKTGGWLEQHTMDVLRGRLLRELREADRADRLRVYCVRLSTEPRVTLMIHAKIMIADDRIVRIASSNLSNRSMGLDSECDLAIEAGRQPEVGPQITRLRRRLLAEHLDVDLAAVTDAESDSPSLIRAVESLRGRARTLEPLNGEVPDGLDEWVPDSALLDPERPVEPEELLEYLVRPRRAESVYRNLLKLGLWLLAVVGLAAAWRWTPLSRWLDLDRLIAAGAWMRARPFTPVLVLAAYVLTGLVALPVTLLFVATVTLFGPWLGSVYALVGAELSAVATFGIGRLLGRRALERVAGRSLQRVRRMLTKRGIWAIIVLRVVPVAPFSLVNAIIGASGIRLRDFVVGNLLGLLPGVLGIALVTDRVLQSLRDPGVINVLLLLLVAAAAWAGVFGLHRWLRHRPDDADS